MSGAGGATAPPAPAHSGAVPAGGAGALLDTLRVHETPEGVDLGLGVAGPVPRALALVVDTAIRFGLYLVLTPLLALSGVGMGLLLIGVFLVEWFYPVAFEVLYGATPGKRALGLAVVHDDGTPVGLAASTVRNLLRVVDFLPIFYGVGLVATLADRDFRRLGDLAAGTLVIHAPPRPRTRSGARAGTVSPATFRPAPEADPPARAAGPLEAARDAPPRPPPRPLPLETQRAILAYAERAPRLSAARREELARTLVTALDDGDGLAPGPDAAAERVLGYAAWLARGR